MRWEIEAALGISISFVNDVCVVAWRTPTPSTQNSYTFKAPFNNKWSPVKYNYIFS